MKRRTFLQGAGTAGGLLLLKPATVFGYPANSAVNYALLGCGNRGTAVAESFVKNANVRLVALGDIFSDKLATAKKHFDQLNVSLGKSAIDPAHTYHGYEACNALAADTSIDAVQISTPAFFHVDQLDILTAGGKHVYIEKPIGVDVPQTRRALEIAKRVDGKVSIAVGFQIRKAPPFVEIVQRIQRGDIGGIASTNGYYNAPPAVFHDVKNISPDEYRLRNWLRDKNLSGDILLEQNIHVIDMCNWIMGANPIGADARASRKVVRTFGNTNDNYEVIFTYPGNVQFVFSSTQFNKNGFFDVAANIFGSQGIAETSYTGQVRILGDKPWAWSGDKVQKSATFAANGAFLNNLADADKMKDRDFIESITNNKYQNQIAEGVRSAQTCMMGRKSAELGRPVTWNEIQADNEQYEMGFDITKFR